MSDVKSSPAERENKWRRSASQTLCVPLALTPPPHPSFIGPRSSDRISLPTAYSVFSMLLKVVFLPLHNESTYGCRMVFKDRCNTGVELAFF